LAFALLIVFLVGIVFLFFFLFFVPIFLIPFVPVLSSWVVILRRRISPSPTFGRDGLGSPRR
jgi:hypothetical protein